MTKRPHKSLTDEELLNELEGGGNQLKVAALRLEFERRQRETAVRSLFWIKVGVVASAAAAAIAACNLWWS